MPSPTHPPKRPTLRTVLLRFRSDTRGATVIEYGLIASLVTIALIGALQQFGGATNTLYNRISTAMNATP